MTTYEQTLTQSLSTHLYFIANMYSNNTPSCHHPHSNTSCPLLEYVDATRAIVELLQQRITSFYNGRQVNENRFLKDLKQLWQGRGMI